MMEKKLSVVKVSPRKTMASAQMTANLVKDWRKRFIDYSP
jgi:hypothetical protein